MNASRIGYLLAAALGAVMTYGLVAELTGITEAGFFSMILVLAFGIYFAKGATEPQAPKRPEGWSDEAWNQYLKQQQGE